MVTSVGRVNGGHGDDWLATDCPAVLVHGTRSDTLTAEHAQEMADRCPPTGWSHPRRDTPCTSPSHRLRGGGASLPWHRPSLLLTVRPGRQQRASDARAEARTAVWTARARRAPHRERGPAKGWGTAPGPGVRAATHTASVGVPEQSNPASSRAWTLASVAVATALTRAASVSATGSATTMLTVPGWTGAYAPPVPGTLSAPDAPWASGSPSASGTPSAGDAAHPRTRSPAVATASTPLSWP
ncbi:Hydrolase (plasmid) [Streptomyces clavuligerus]|uniref:Hydrolase n=1 Tax=Streptomyces clavuligerus TaxID=1901 RepID=D5SM93_STRCL|nr:Hydrolase [Streptomyces clavuligerus]